MGRIRVLVVDDSVVVRRLVSDVLAEDPEIEIVGAAANGRIALAKIEQLRPDVVTLDIEMPEMDGLTCITEIRKTWPQLPVIMFSTLTERGAAATLEALARGATDYVTKPTNVGGAIEARQRLRELMIPMIKALLHRPEHASLPSESRSSQALSKARPLSAPRSGGGSVDVLAIGVSTGGPNALAALFAEFPPELPVPVLVVQHMPPIFTRLLAERLDAKSALRVREAEPGAVLEAGHAWVAAGDYHLALERRGASLRLVTSRGPPENSCRPAVDVLFRSVAEVYGPRCLALVLTGMGKDGLRGCEAIREQGGQVVVQDEATSVVWGMPGVVAQAGLAECVLPLSEIAGEVVRRVTAGRPRLIRSKLTAIS